ncbi:2-hydroxyacid dehydrogenase [soil metagenome]
MSESTSVLLRTTFSPVLLDKLAGRHHELVGPVDGDLAQALDEATRDRITALVTMGSSRIDASVMDALPKIAVICCSGAGYDGIDLQEAARRGIAVSHSPSANAGSVADFAIGLMIASVRRIVSLDRYMHTGAWQGNSVSRVPTVRGLTSRKAGVYGMGSIGKKIAQRAAAFDMEVGYFSRRPKEDVPYQYFPSLMAMAQWADVLMVSVEANASTRHTVDAAVLEALGPDGHVVNVSRGYVIDEDALISALQSGRLGGAGLDVFEHEPVIPAALMQLDNVVITPHIAGTSKQSQEIQYDMIVANLDHFLATGKVLNAVPGA